MTTMFLVIKETAWYRMRTEQTKPKLQFEEDITACKWVNTSGLSKMKSKVYPNLKMLVDSMV